jgi:hypothetical protein
MHPYRYQVSRYVFFAALILLALCIIPAYLLDPRVSNENGPVETAQNLVLLSGFLISVFYSVSTQGRERALWIFGASLLYIAFWRELGWGAAIFALFNPQIDPNTFSSHSLWYRPIVRPLIVSIALIGLVAFISGKAWRLAQPLHRGKMFPVQELIWLTIAAAVSTAAEGKMGLSLPFGDDVNFNIEELAELSAYLFLIAAVFRVKAGLDRSRPLSR